MKVYEICPDFYNASNGTSVVAYEKDIKSALHFFVDLNFDKALEEKHLSAALDEYDNFRHWSVNEFNDFMDADKRDELLSCLNLYKDETYCVFYGELKEKAYAYLDREIAELTE